MKYFESTEDFALIRQIIKLIIVRSKFKHYLTSKVFLESNTISFKQTL